MSTPRESPTIRIAALGLAVIAFVSVIAISLLAYEKVDVPGALAATAGGAVSALATLLTTFTPAPLPGGRRLSDPTPEPGDVPGTTLAGPVGITK